MLGPMLLFTLLMHLVGVRMFMEEADVTLYQVTKGSECGSKVNSICVLFMGDQGNVIMRGGVCSMKI